MKLLFSIAFLLLISTTIATPQAVEPSAVEKAIDLYNCKIIEFSLAGTSRVDQFQSECNCNNNVDFEHLISFLKREKIDASRDLSEEINKLKGKFNSNSSVENIVNFISVDVFRDKNNYPNLFAFENKRNASQGYKDFKLNLSTTITKFLSNPDAERAEQKVNELSQRVEEMEQELQRLRRQPTTAQKTSWFSMELDVVSLGFAITLFAGLLYYINKRRRHRHQKHEREENPLPPYPSAFLEFNRVDINEFKRLQSEVSEVRLQIQNLEMRSKQEIEQATHERPTPLTENNAVQPSHFYFSTPDADGSFSENAGHQSYREGASIYKFKKLTAAQAEFQIDERESSVKLALQYPDKNIDPVCEALNAFNPKSKNISTVDGGGLAELVGGKWKVTKKARIRYDS